MQKNQTDLCRTDADSTEYQRIFKETPAAMYIFDDAEFKLLAVNDAALCQYGYSTDEFLALKATNLRPQSELHGFYEAVKTIPDTYLDVGRFIHKRKNGELFYVHIYSHNTTFEGKPAKLVMAIDIDKKVKTEIALKEKSEEINNILESITDAFYAVDTEWRFTYVNKEYERIQNRKREDLIGKNVWEVFPYVRELRFYKEYERAMREKVSVHFEGYNPATGIWVRVNAYPTPNGLAIYFRDITAEKRVQEKIYNDEQNLRAIINNTEDLIWSVDKSFKVITANNAFWERVAHLTGKTSANLMNADFDPTFFKPFLRNYKKAFRGRVFKVFRERQRDDGLHYEEINFNPICDQNNMVIGVNCFLRDVTREYKYLERIKKQNEQLKEIAWLNSHKVRVPIANMQGLLQILDTCAGPEDRSHDETLCQIRLLTKQLDEVISDINSQAEGLAL
jgi:PAS domain S-box-containing protein